MDSRIHAPLLKVYEFSKKMLHKIILSSYLLILLQVKKSLPNSILANGKCRKMERK